MKYSILIRALAISLCFLSLPSSAFTQTKPVIFGTVIDEETGEPLIHANVYLSNTFKGGSTNKDGKYIINNIDRGFYSLTASYVGYETIVVQVHLDLVGGYIFDFALTAKEHKIEEIVVEGKKPSGWDKNLKLFTQYFLGTSYYSKQCKILNPFVMDFTNNRKTKDFTAVADEMIIIENRALGYILHYSLLDFNVDRKRLLYWGEPYFEEMTSENDDELKKWKENREKAYFGSMRHFLKSLTDSNWNDEWYELSLMDAIPPDNNIDIPVKAPETLFKKINDNEYELNFEGFLKIHYLPGAEYNTTLKAINEAFFPGFGTPTLIERELAISYVVIKNRPALFDGRGIFIDPFDVQSHGTWSKERVVDLLPWEYKPGGK